MKILSFSPGHTAQTVELKTPGGEDVFYWIDIERSDSDWHERVRPWLSTRLDERHIHDSLNATHPPFYDGTDDYDMLIVRAPGTDNSPEALSTGSVALFIAPGVVISIRPHQPSNTMPMYIVIAQLIAISRAVGIDERFSIAIKRLTTCGWPGYPSPIPARPITNPIPANMPS